MSQEQIQQSQQTQQTQQSQQPLQQPQRPSQQSQQPSQQVQSQQPQATLPASATNGGREINPKMLHVADLDRAVTEEMLTELFKTLGSVVSVKILPDRNSRQRLNYAFVEYENEDHAKEALNALNGKIVNNTPIKIKYGYQTSQAITDSENFNVFVGDLSSEINDESLNNAFGKYSSVKEARVMWDMSTGRSRGYGFVSFGDGNEAERAIREMNGEWLGSRAIRCNWAQKRSKTSSSGSGSNSPGVAPTGIAHNTAPNLPPIPQNNNYNFVLQQSPSWQTTVYIGNLAPFTPAQELLPILQNFGYIVEFKHQPERGYAFVRYDSHERAAMAIVQLSNMLVNGRGLKCGWGKERPPASSPYP